MLVNGDLLHSRFCVLQWNEIGRADILFAFSIALQDLRSRVLICQFELLNVFEQAKGDGHRQNGNQYDFIPRNESQGVCG